jgi:hypothetical protein
MVRPAAPRTPRLDRCTEPVAEKLRVGVLRELEQLHERVTALTAIVNAIDVTVGNAPAAAQFLCLATSAGLTQERVFTLGNGLDAVDGGADGNYTVTVDETELNAASIGGAAEFVQDTVAALIDDTATITWSYDDVTASLTATCSVTQYTDELAQDAVAAMVVAGHGMDIVYVDGTPTLTFDVDESELDGTLLGGVSSVVDVETTDLQVSSTSLRDIYVFAIPAGTFTAGDVMRVAWNGHFFNNDGANRSMDILISLGGVTIWRDTSNTQTVSANRRWLRIEFDVVIVSDTLHIANAEIRFGTATAATTGVGDIAASGQIFGGGESIDSTVDLSAAQTLRIQVAIGPAITNSANVYVRRRCAYTERLRA